MIFVPLAVAITAIALVLLAFFMGNEKSATAGGFVITVILMPFLLLAFLVTGTTNGRNMELCDQAEGVYSMWTEQCTTPTEVIELETGDE